MSNNIVNSTNLKLLQYAFSYIKLKAVQMLAHNPTTVVQQFIINVVKLHYKTAALTFNNQIFVHLMYNRSYLENRRKNYSFLVQEDKENWFKTWEKSNLDLLTLLSPCTAYGAADNTCCCYCCCSTILLVSKPSIWCSLAKYQIRTSTQKTLESGSGMGPIAKSHMGRYSSSSFFFPHEHQLELLA